MDGSAEFNEEDCFLAKEQMARTSTLVRANFVSSVPRVHGVEDCMGSRFWALGEESELESEDDDSIVSIDTPELIEAEKELNDESSVCSPRGSSLANKIVNKIVDHQLAGRPWRGKLPSPRISPPRTIGDAIASAKVRNNPSHSTPSPATFKTSPFKASSPTRLSPASETVQILRSASSGCLGRVSRKVDGSKFECSQRMDQEFVMGPSPVMVLKRICLNPDVPYRPTQGLEALFSRTGTTSRNPRAPHCAAFHNTTTSYVEVARLAMESGGSQGARCW